MSDEVKTETIETKKDENITRREAVEKGVKELDDKGQGFKEISKSTETNTDESNKSTKEEEIDEDTTSETEVDEEEQKNALQLFRALNDPTSGPKILKILAEEAGLLATSTEKEVKQVTRSIKDVVKEKLGPEYQFLSDRMADALEEVVSSIVKKEVGEVRDNLAQRDRNDLGKTIDAALNDCFAQYETVPNIVQKRFNELIDEMPPVPGKTEPRKYFDRLIKIAADESNITLVRTKTSDASQKSLSDSIKERVQRNRRDASSRLASKGAEAEVDDTSKSVSTPIKSRREAIERAVKETEAKMGVR